MKYERLRDAAEVVGIAAIVGSLIFVGLQMKQAQEIAYSELDVSLVAIGVETAAQINDHADVWVKGNVGEELDPADHAIFLNLVTNLNNRWFIEYRHANQLGRPDIAETIKHDWSAFLYQNPGARAVWLAREESLGKFRRLLVPDGDQFSFWKESILADLATLDETDD